MRSASTLLKSCALSLAIASGMAFAAPDAPSGKIDMIDIPFEKFQLDNGLTVVVHEDHKAPVVAVSIWYHVGSADEPVGKTGFAHLFEHLMFSGSENHKGTYFQPFELAGATDMNGTTWFDRTNYFETVPTTALDMALWMESDRMGHLLSAIGKTELDTQRGVVQNEKRQGENEPYGRTDENILLNAFPANHPYHHDTIGSMADLDAASLEDVKQWFRDYYGSANTTVVIAGDGIARGRAREGAESISATFRPDRRCRASRPGLLRAANRRAARRRTTSRKRVSIANGTCRSSAPATIRCSASPPACSAAARPRASTNAWSTRTSSSTT